MKVSEELRLEGLTKLERLEKEIREKRSVGITGLTDIMADPNFLAAVYRMHKSKPGMMTPGVDGVTLDGISDEWFKETSQTFRSGRFQFKPAKRVAIPKAKGGIRYLGIPTLRDRIVQGGMKTLLELIFEPTFAESSHGYRPKRSCHTAINWIRTRMNHMSWFIEGDISKCFDNVSHQRLMRRLEDAIQDQPFMDLVYKALKAGYVEHPKGFVKTKVGTPQGGMLSPLLANIYLDQLDKWMEERSKAFDKGTRRRANPEYTRTIRGGRVSRDKYIPPLMGSDESYKRLKYVRYADDFLIGVSGSLADCRSIRDDLSEFLNNELGLDLNMGKTLITHARTESATFLGHRIHITDPSKYQRRYVEREGQKRLTWTTPRPMVDVPIQSLVKELTEQGYCKPGGRPTGCGRLLHESLSEIVKRYRLLEQGLLNYYHMATNYGRAAARIHYILKYSCALTIAKKMRRATLKKVFNKYGGPLTIKDDTGKCIASYPTVSYKKPRRHVNTEVVSPIQLIQDSAKYWRRSLPTAGLVCAVCQAPNGIVMHHVRHLRIGKTQDWLTERMRKMNRKQIPVCRECHVKIHKGKHDGLSLKKLQG